MPSASATATAPARTYKLGIAWLGFCAALALHVTDEALTGFLSVYNPTILAFRPTGWWFPPTFEFRVWLGGLVAGIALLLVFSPLFFRGARHARPAAYVLAVMVGILNALGHITGTILGHTAMSVRFPRPMPGFYSSPVLLAASVYLIFALVSATPKRSERTLPSNIAI
jgi:hypothetical protein